MLLHSSLSSSLVGVGGGVGSQLGSAHASSFLGSIALRVDPSAPPPPLYPPVSLRAARDAIATVGHEEWNHWAAHRHAASEAFLAHIPTGHESADQRPQPTLHLARPPQHHHHPSADSFPSLDAPFAGAPHASAGSMDAAAAAALASAARNPSLQFLGGSAQLAVPAASRAGTGSSAFSTDSASVCVDDGMRHMASSEMLLYANGEARLQHSDGSPPAPPPIAAGLPLPMRIQTPPPLMGAGIPSGSALAHHLLLQHDGSGGACPPAVGALFGTGVLFPVTLSSPLDLSRSATANDLLALQHAGQHARLSRTAMPPRSTSEYAQQQLQLQMQQQQQQYGGASGLVPPFPTPNLSQQHSFADHAEEALSPIKQVQQQQQQQQQSSGSDDGSSSMRTPKGGDMRDAAGSPLASSLDGNGSTNALNQMERFDRNNNINNTLPRTLFRSSPLPSIHNNHGGSAGELIQLQGQGSQSQLQLQPQTPASFLRSDGSGRGLADPDAHFVPGRLPGQSADDWERELIARGLLDGRIIFTPMSVSSHATRSQQQQQQARVVHRYGGAGSHAMGGPVWLSSLSAFVPREHSSSNSSSAPSTPRAGGMGGPIRSRASSFSLEPGGLLLGATLPGHLVSAIHADHAHAHAGHGHGRGGAGLHGDGALLSLLDSGSVGNSMLAFAAAVAAAQLAQEASYENDDSLVESAFNMFGKKQGTSYAFLLRPFPAAPMGHSNGSSGSGGGGGGGVSSPTHKHKPSSLHAESGSGGGGGGSGAAGSKDSAGSKAAGSGKSGGGGGGASGSSGGGGGGGGGPSTLPSSSSSASSSSSTALSLSQVRSSNELYDPCFLDDPNVKSGKHRVLLQLPGFMSSLVSYVRSKELVAEMNASFASRHSAWLDPSLHMSLSKVRKCKQLLLDVVVRLDLEMSTCAAAFIYFEKLLLRNHVHKANRKLIAAVCLLLAFKWTEGSGGMQRHRLVAATFAAMEKTFHVTRAAVLKAEFAVFVSLDFDLTVKTEHVLHHFRLCLSKLDTVPADYRNIEWSL